VSFTSVSPAMPSGVQSQSFRSLNLAPQAANQMR
jgi:hypothetical protein